MLLKRAERRLDWIHGRGAVGFKARKLPLIRKGGNIMEKKILMAVDDSIHSNQSLRYATKMFSGSRDVTFTLFNEQPMISQYLVHEARTDPKAYASLKKVIKKNTAEAQMLLEKQKKRMIAMGVPNKRIELVAQQRMLGRSQDILEYARKGLYDAIVVGRRGLSRIQKTFMGSTSAELLENADEVPVWMVDGKVTSPKILVAVDGSESSYRALDHVGSMLFENAETRYCLFHVSQKAKDMDALSFAKDDLDIQDIVAKSSKRMMGEFFAAAEQKLKDAGIAADRVDIITKAKRKASVGKMVLAEAEKGKFGTVVVGRRGADRAHYFGSVSRYVTQRMTDRALWLVP
jgi:nucleotide-binding universal stress UspA family protein